MPESLVKSASLTRPRRPEFRMGDYVVAYVNLLWSDVLQRSVSRVYPPRHVNHSGDTYCLRQRVLGHVVAIASFPREPISRALVSTAGH